MNIATTNMNIASKIWNCQNKHEHSMQNLEWPKQTWTQQAKFGMAKTNMKNEPKKEKKKKKLIQENFKCWALTECHIESSR